MQNLNKELTDLSLWRHVYRSINPEIKDEWAISEGATALRLMAQLWYDNRKELNRIADKCGGLEVNWSIKSDRSFEVPVVRVNGSFSEKHPMKAESEVPDPKAMELPFERVQNNEN
jgi:hypothetical protein